MFILKLLSAFSVWTIFGHMVTVIFGIIGEKIMRRKLNLKDSDDSFRELKIRQLESTGQINDTTFIDIFVDDITWPWTIYHAYKGLQKIINKEKS